MAIGDHIVSKAPIPEEDFRRISAPDRGRNAITAVALCGLLLVGAFACQRDAEPDAGSPLSKANVGSATVSRTDPATPAISSAVVPTPLPTAAAEVVQKSVQVAPRALSSSPPADTTGKNGVKKPGNEPPSSALSAPTDTGSVRTGDERLAPTFVGLSGWINSEPQTLESLHGQVVLIDFWTYTCVNCIRTFPYLRQWNDKYRSSGLFILGVHTPEFEFEKLLENVTNAVDSFEIEYAIVQDNDRRTWNAFRNKVWPGKYLIDKDGYIRYQHLGEGDYQQTEQTIRQLLVEAGADLANIPSDTAPEPEVDPDSLTALPAKGLTRELYAGYERNRAAMSSRNNPPYFLQIEFYEYPDTDLLYTDIGERLNHFIVLQGLWRNELESLVHGRATKNYEDYIAVPFVATSVNAVMDLWAKTPYTVRLLMDGVPLSPSEAGADVLFDDEGNSYVLVTEPRMYRLVNLDRFGEHELKLSSNSYEFSVFAFTFSDYAGGEPDP